MRAAKRDLYLRSARTERADRARVVAADRLGLPGCISSALDATCCIRAVALAWRTFRARSSDAHGRRRGASLAGSQRVRSFVAAEYDFVVAALSGAGLAERDMTITAGVHAESLRTDHLGWAATVGVATDYTIYALRLITGR